MKDNLILRMAFISVCMGTLPMQAEIKLSSIWGENMVLQQKANVLFHGTALPDKKVVLTTSWGKEKFTAKSDKEGNWSLNLPTPEAGGPYSITITDGKSLTLNNILIGEVWFCSGQSNMEMPVKGFRGQPVLNSQPYIVSANPKRSLRLFTVSNAWSTTPKADGIIGKWVESTPQNVANFSATGYFFGDLLQKSLNIPVGLIQCAWSASKIEAWMDEMTLGEFPDIELPNKNQTEFGWPAGTPTLLWNAMVNPWKGMPIKGVIWYQGEANTPDPANYKRLFPKMVEQWRMFFNSSTLPFYYVQIAPWRSEGKEKIDWALFRESQLELMKEVRDVGMVTTGDVGSEIFIHPPHKIKVGERLAYWALAKTYGLSGFQYSGPLYKQYQLKDNKVVELEFEHGQDGLIPENQRLEGFEIAGEDGCFMSAEAEIINGSALVRVWSDSVVQPKEIRYCFRNYMEGNLSNNAGIPASPFRIQIK